ncbi:hypothetical protein [Streptomyces sp. NBC_01483]|nr:hypothetical protein [Streptomyces sp. NBC_01483]
MGLLAADKQELRRIPRPDIAYSVEREIPSLPADAAFPSARAFCEGRTV